MMDVIAAIKGRRSIRRFTEQDISGEQLAQILEAVRWAPSWGNSQCWEVLVVRDRGKKQQLHDALSPRNPAGPAVTAAPVVLVVGAAMKKSGHYKGESLTRFAEWFMYDLGLATQNLCLAAHSLGLGSVIAGAFDHDKVKEILAVPAGYEVVTMIPLGYPDHEPSAPKRKEVEEFTHYEHFSR
ncbi:MAG: nitroreductase family protein [Proteobacteria bacterium]|nr:nitroreductase family protein [Pseudomonadota bacterium]MBU4295311.1 nitroreductase family protein [Pseudomonadota bacterium]MCG2748164.1 nitroreductase family protein [Desulfobulbaceae bacterium]